LLIAEVAVVLIILELSPCSAQTDKPYAACNVKVELLPRLDPLVIQTGHLENGKGKCFKLFARKGEFVHASLSIDSGYARTRIFRPHQDNPLLENWLYAFDNTGYSGLPLAFEAPVSGWYVLEVTGWENNGSPFMMQLDEIVPAKMYSARSKSLSNDARTVWLRNNAATIRSIDPDDEDFSDLTFLREQLNGVRVVLLGESDHGNGADFKAKTRLIKFLHREMGFDVLALESGIFGTPVAWRALSVQAEPRDAFLRGVFPVWGLSEQIQPLIRYLAAAKQTDHPLELTGFDCQFREPAARDSLVPSLREFLTRSGINSALSDTNSRQTHILEWAVEGQIPPDSEPKPQPAEKAGFIQSLKATAEAVEMSANTHESQFWAQVLRSVSAQISNYYYWNEPETDQSAIEPTRDHQMGDNLIWLANKYYQGRKIIVWAHTFHTMRNPRHTVVNQLQEYYHMGQHVWEVLGSESFVIGMTSYTGISACITCRGGMEGLMQNIIEDQDPSFEFEELMNAAGYKFGFVNLRKAREKVQWLGGTFAARPLLQTYIATWSEMLDALFFIQTQEPSRKVEDVR
jgi:erythromycin esterase